VPLHSIYLPRVLVKGTLLSKLLLTLSPLPVTLLCTRGVMLGRRSIYKANIPLFPIGKEVAVEKVTGPGVRRVEHLLPLVIKALDNETRWRILQLLIEAKDRLSFFFFFRQFRGMSNASLSHHLNVLQRAALVERTVDLASPRTAKDPFYCFYAPTKFGRTVAAKFYEAVSESAELVLH